MQEHHPQPDLDGYTKNGFYGRVQDQILRLEAEGRKARTESFIVIPKQGIWKRMGHRTFYRLFGLHYISEEDDPVTKGIQAAINRAHSKIFIKDGNYFLSQTVQYPTSAPNNPSVLWYDFPKAIVLEGESPDAVLQLYSNNGVDLFVANDNYVNKHPYLKLQTLTIEGVGTSPTNAQGRVQGFALGGESGGYIFLWDITLKNVQDQTIFATDFLSVRNMRIINTLQNTGPVQNPGGLNPSGDTQGEIDGYYVYGYADNALAFNGSPGWFQADNIHIFRGGLTQTAWAVDINITGPPLNINFGKIVTDGGIFIANVVQNATLAANINIGQIQLLPTTSTTNVGLVIAGSPGSTVTDINIGRIILNNQGIGIEANVDRVTIGECELYWNNPNAAMGGLVSVGGSYTGKIRFGKVKINIVAQPSTAVGYIIASNSTFTVDIDELSVAVAPGQGGFLLTGAQTPSPGSRIKRALINGVLQSYPVLPIPPEILVNPPASGVTYQNNNAATIVLLVPVALTPTSTAAASASIAVGTSPSTLSTVQTLTQAAGAGPAGGVLQAAVPAAQYYQITLTNATAYQAIVLPE